MIRSLLLFAHIVGMLTLFVGLGLELFSLESLRRSSTRGEASPWIRMYRALPRVYGIAFGLILLSGIYLAVRVGVHQFAWVRVSFGAMLLMGIAGRPLIRSRVRAIYLMISKVGVAHSLLAMGMALLGAVIASAYDSGRPAPETTQSIY